MTLTFRSSIPETWKISSVDTNGRERVAVATRNGGDFNWRMNLQHPSGRKWDATYHGNNIIDALGEFVNSKDVEYTQERGRGYKPLPTESFDYSRRLPEDGMIAPVVASPRNRR
jgi:hypothetical protein